MTKYLVLPITVYASWIESRSDAMAEAQQSASKYEEDFVVLSIEFVGGYERVSPIKIDADPHPPKEVTSPNARVVRGDASNAPPF